MECMANCHSIISLNNELFGDPMELELFNVTKSTLESI